MKEAMGLARYVTRLLTSPCCPNRRNGVAFTALNGLAYYCRTYGTHFSISSGEYRSVPVLLITPGATAFTLPGN